MKFPLVSLLFLMVVLLTLRTLKLRRILFTIITVLAFGAFVFECLITFDLLESHKTLISIVTLSSFAIFIGISILLMIHDLFSEQFVNSDSIRGGISIYLLIGIFWAILYQLIMVLDPSAFVLTAGKLIGDVRYMLFYYSFTTLTTLAYGDILPANEPARILSALEGMAGVLFLTIFVAQLVNLHVFHKSSRLKPPESLEK